MLTSIPGTIEPAPATSSLVRTQWTRPQYALPVPSLRFVFHLECDMEAFRHVGPGPHGDRSTVIFKGGRFEGPSIKGRILPGGGDWEIVRNHRGDGGEEVQTAHLDTRYNLETDDGVIIYLQTTGTRTGKREVLERLGEGRIGSSEYLMRLHATFETGDERYKWLNDGVFVCSSGRVGTQVIYDCYQLL